MSDTVLDVVVRAPDHWSRAHVRSLLVYEGGSVAGVPARTVIHDADDVLVLRHEVPDAAGAKASLQVRARWPGHDGPPLLAQATQTFTLVPAADGRGRRFRPVADLDPLLEGLCAAGEMACNTFVCHLDFLEVTEHVTAMTERPVAALLRQIVDEARPLGVQVRLFEWTQGSPMAWLVLSPPAALAQKDQRQILMFFTPPGNDGSAVHSVGDVDLGTCWRYLVSPLHKEYPWFLEREGSVWRWKEPVAGFARQLQRAARPVHVVFPVPHGGEYFKRTRSGG